jgi:geranylgeranyl diphosphate synthase type II
MAERRQLVEAGLRTWLERVAAGAPPILIDAMGHSLLAPGKRLRPLLVLMSAEAAGGTTEQALPAACAVEMTHAYSLVHDDLPAMDDDDLRRGQPTCHKKYGEAVAILAGDSLLTGAFQVLAEGYPSRTAAVSCMELAVAAGGRGMVGGQILDLAAEGKVAMAAAPQTAEELRAIHRMKTGSLFLACPRLGLLAAQGERPTGPDPATRSALDQFGRAFGLAFQIADDLLDVQGSSDRAGKSVGKDAARGKLTYPGLLGVAESRRQMGECYSVAAAAVESLGSHGRPLAELVRLVSERDR